MNDPTENASAGDDRTVWDRAWSSMPHRRIAAPEAIDLRPLLGDSLAEAGVPVSITIALDPPRFAPQGWRPSEFCPLCGALTNRVQRLPASIHLRFASGLSVGIGVWVHRACFERCPEAGEPAPIPW
jgi:hypothetical protein